MTSNFLVSLLNVSLYINHKWNRDLQGENKDCQSISFESEIHLTLHFMYKKTIIFVILL